MDLPTIQEMWKKDSVIDKIMLDEASLKIPQLHQKYLVLLNEFNLLRKKKRQDLKRMEHKKWMYYSGKAPAEDYEAEPFNHKVMKSDVPAWVSVDKQVNDIEMKLEYYNEVCDTLQEILRQVNQMSYNIKNAIQWRTFTNGV